jgi:hypothetical protein
MGTLDIYGLLKNNELEIVFFPSSKIRLKNYFSWLILTCRKETAFQEMMKRRMKFQNFREVLHKKPGIKNLYGITQYRYIQTFL